MSVNVQGEFSVVGGGVQFAPAAAFGWRTKRSGFISGPDLCVLWICTGIWEAVALQGATWSFLQKPLTFGCFRCLVGWGWGGGRLHPSVPLGHSEKPSGCVLYTRVLLRAWDQGSPVHHTCTRGCCWLCIRSQLPGDAGAAASEAQRLHRRGDLTAFRRPRFEPQLCRCLLEWTWKRSLSCSVTQFLLLWSSK